MAWPPATTRVPTRVTTAAAMMAAAGVASATKPATSSGPITKTISNSDVSAASAVLRRWNRPLTGLVSAFQAPRMAAVIGG